MFVFVVGLLLLVCLWVFVGVFWLLLLCVCCVCVCVCSFGLLCVFVGGFVGWVCLVMLNAVITLNEMFLSASLNNNDNAHC